MIKVLHVNYNDEGGAYVALKRLDEALRTTYQDTIESEILIISPSNTNNRSLHLGNSPVKKLLLFLRPRIVRIIMQAFFKEKKGTTVSYNLLPSYQLINFINASDFDIVHLHWIGGETLSINDFSRIKKKVVWTLHDCWAYLGRYHYPGIDDSVKQFDGLDKYLINKKSKSWRGLNTEIVCVSDWLYQNVIKRSIFKSAHLSKIGNTINDNFWMPFNKLASRSLLGLDSNKIYLCTGAIHPTSNPTKGFYNLEKALKLLPQNLKANVELLMFGTSGPDSFISGFRTKFLGQIKDEVAVKLILDASDVVLVPSYYESFGQVALEAICLQKLVVCFDSSGTADIVEHHLNGYLAKSYSPQDFANGILWALNEHNNVELKTAGREKVVSKFNYAVIARQYYNVYTELLKAN